MDRTALSSHVRILARGPGRSRNLTQEEAYEAMSLILTGDAPPEAVGALLMLMRFRGSNPDELSGFIKATHATLPNWMQDLNIDLDWSSYAAGRTRGLPYFLLSAQLLAQNGTRIFMHGFNSHHMHRNNSTEAALKAIGLKPATTEAEIKDSLEQHNFAYQPLISLSPVLYDLINLRDVLGLRSPINTLLRGLNPAHASASIIGVFHPAYVILQLGVAEKMSNGSAIVFKAGGGEAERTPLKPVKMSYTKNGTSDEAIFPAIIDKKDHKAKEEGDLDPAVLKAVWDGDHKDERAEAIIIATASTALFILDKADSPEQADNLALQMWQQR